MNEDMKRLDKTFATKITMNEGIYFCFLLCCSVLVLLLNGSADLLPQAATLPLCLLLQRDGEPAQPAGPHPRSHLHRGNTAAQLGCVVCSCVDLCQGARGSVEYILFVGEYL